MVGHGFPLHLRMELSTSAVTPGCSLLDRTVLKMGLCGLGRHPGLGALVTEAAFAPQDFTSGPPKCQIAPVLKGFDSF